MSTQQDIYATGYENRPPMLNKENYVPCSSRLPWYAKSRPNRKLIYNSIMNGPYVRRMIPEPGDADHEVPINETFHEQTNDKLTEKELKQVEADYQAIQTILLGLPEDIYAAVDSFVLMAKAFNLNYSTPTNNNQRISSNPRNMQIAQSGQNVRNQNGYNAVQNAGNQNPNRNGNVVAVRADGNAIGNNGKQIRCYNCRGLGHLARNCIVKPRRRDAAYLQTQFKHSYHRVLRLTNSPIYDSDGSAEVHNYDNCYDNEIFNITTPNQHPATVEETCAYFESLYNNLAIEVEKVNTVNRKLRETNVDLTTKLARYKNQENCVENSQEKYDKVERCYQKSAYQEKCLTKKMNALHLSFGKQITTLKEEISNLNKQLLKEKSTVSSFLEEKKRFLDQVDTTKGTSTNTKFANQKVDETNDLSKPVTSNSVPTPQESKSVKQVNVIAPGKFLGLNPFKSSREDKFRICCSEGTLVLSEILKELTLLKGNRSTNLVTPSISMKLASTAIPNLPHGSSNFYQVMVMASTIIPPQF
ncbi:retrovirus-related pol polyprotein from transposon TNT 1-94 [Tanacetum coccineum]|uniref:Retrovirus-related pol polyprotein from transposon TNT 1-94 n=1 Tax=Tanacetum coccineum TaxID=301880 RepID=A0ABQ4XWJ7_9ASTR